ncbi:MAG: hypothetical protein LBJ93_03455 [Clostridiales bacterium]|nr:hypothetical protein [Clostridiales bacterium]
MFKDHHDYNHTSKFFFTCSLILLALKFATLQIKLLMLLKSQCLDKKHLFNNKLKSPCDCCE